MKLQAINNSVIVKPDKLKKEMTKSGIILPDTIEQGLPEQGNIVSVGNGVFKDNKLVPMEVKVGQKIMFKRYTNEEIEFEKEKYLIVQEEDILAILE